MIREHPRSRGTEIIEQVSISTIERVKRCSLQHTDTEE